MDLAEAAEELQNCRIHILLFNVLPIEENKIALS